MSILKQKFENYSVQPDEKVWSSIQHTMNTRAVARRRRSIAAVASTLLVGGAVAIIAIIGKNANPVADSPVASQNVQIAQAQIPETITPVEQQTPSAAPAAPAAKTVTANTVQPYASEPQPVATEQPQMADRTAAATARPTAQSVASVAAPAAPTAPVAAPRQPVAGQDESQPEAVEPETDAPASQPTKSPIAPKVANEDLVVWVPNAFAPDDPNSEVNTFKAKPNTDASLISFEIYIYSREGRQVFHSRDINAGWDGTANGHKQPMGTYVYIIELNDAAKGLQHKKGTITLIR